MNMISAPTVVFDLDGTLVDTAPDLIGALNFVLGREGLPPVPLASARNLIGAGARKMIERGLEAEGCTISVREIDRLMIDFIDYYTAHIADASRPFEGLHAALDDLSAGEPGRRRTALFGRHFVLANVLVRPLDGDFEFDWHEVVTAHALGAAGGHERLQPGQLLTAHDLARIADDLRCPLDRLR